MKNISGDEQTFDFLSKMIDNAESRGYFNGDDIALYTVWWYKNPPYHWFISILM